MKLKVAHIVCSFPPMRGGIGNSAWQFSKILSGIGYDVTVFIPRYPSVSGVFLNENEPDGFKVTRLKPLFGYGYAAFLPKLFWKIKDFDILHLHYPFYGTAELVLLRKILFPKTKLIIHYHMDTVGRGWKGLIFKMHRMIILPILVRCADLITCSSIDYIKNSNLGKYYHKFGYKFRQTLFGVDLDFFKPRVGGSDKKNKNILFVSVLDKAHYFKGLDKLFISLSELKNNNWTLTIVGGGEMKEEYEKMCEKLNIKDKVFFAGKVSQEELPKYFNNAYALALPSIDKSEAFGLVLLEALASGLPVIASNLPGVRGIFKNGVEGLKVRPGDIKDLRSKLNAILSYENIAEEMGVSARILAEKKYSYKKLGERLDLIYHYAKYSLIK